MVTTRPSQYCKSSLLVSCFKVHINSSSVSLHPQKQSACLSANVCVHMPLGCVYGGPRPYYHSFKVTCPQRAPLCSAVLNARACQWKTCSTDQIDSAILSLVHRQPLSRQQRVRCSILVGAGGHQDVARCNIVSNHEAVIYRELGCAAAAAAEEHLLLIE